MIDFQNDVWLNERWKCHNVEQVTGQIKSLLAKARGMGVPVIYVQDDTVGPEGSAERQIYPAVAPQPGEPVIRKTACDSFHGTNLHEVLQQWGISAQIIAHINWTLNGFQNLANHVEVKNAEEVTFA